MFERFRALTVLQQVLLATIGVAAFCIVIGVAWLTLFRVPYRVLFTGVRPSDAATIVQDLERKKIPYRLAADGTEILVPAEVADRTRLDVMTEDLPLKGTVGFELFDKSDLGLTDFAQKINYQRALQGELERTIANLDGVDAVRVHLSLGEDRVFRDDRVPPKASVTIRMRRGLTLAAEAARGIQKLVAAAVPSLDSQNVVILDAEGRVVGTTSVSTSEPGTLAPESQERRAIEQFYEARVRLALDRAYPLNGMTVAVTAAPGQSADWSPSTRLFPLSVTLTSGVALDQVARDNVRALLASAIGFDAAKNDVLAFVLPSESLPLPQVRKAARPRQTLMLPEAPAPEADIATELAATLGVLAIAALFVVVVIRWTRRPRRLTDDERSDLAAKFRAALAQGDAHAS